MLLSLVIQAGLAVPVMVVMETSLGKIEVAVETAKAPVTAANFLRYVDEGLYDNGRWHRTVKMNNQPQSPIRIEVIQGGRSEGGTPNYDAIPLERTTKTGLLHKDAVISMARFAPDSARSDFFICIGDQPELDFGGKRNPDGQGFAAFGRVISGMDVVRRIQQAPNNEGQKLTPPIAILRVYRR
jgi:peptidyl-prolyl cis-trans isomerase A (cyclophilin A)